ncbi:MAG: hypothetical protein JWR69_3624, partial [Pedosphaera sp.]|nr:hypothetical protein [Pedosphaera sp.]
VTLPIYPDGPVTLRLPIRFTGDSKEISVQVAVGFMACKTDGICLFPVKRQILDLKILPFQLPPTKIDQANRHPAFPFHARRPSRSAPIPHYAKTPPAYAGG